MMIYINTFLFYSIMGHMMENFVYQKIDSGILYGYWTPIYGLAVLMILLIFAIIKKKIKNKPLRALVLFITSAVLLGILEMSGGYLIEKAFGRIFWDYSNQKWHIGKYTSLKMMLLWGTCSLLLIYVVHPFVRLFLKRIPSFITIIISLAFLGDLIYTLITLS